MRNIENLIGKRPDKQRPSYSERMKRPRKNTKSEREMRRHLTGTAASEFKLTPADRYIRRQHPNAEQRKGRGIGGTMKKSEVMKKRKGM